MSLRRRVLWGTLAVSTVTLLVGLVGAAAISRSTHDAQRAEVARQGVAAARLVESALEAGPLRRSRVVADVLATVRAVGGHDYVEAGLRTANGSVTVLGGQSELLAEIPAAGIDGRVVAVEVDGTPVLATVAVVETEGRGDILLAMGSVETGGVGATVGTTILIALGVGAVVAVALAVALSSTLGRRLDRVAGAARSYAAGDFEVRIGEDGDRELLTVAAAFNDMADRLDAARHRERDFLLSVGHDLRTPLTTIRGYAEALAAGDISMDELQRVGGVLEAQATRLARLVEDLMLLARLEADEFRLDPEPVDLAAHLQGIVDAHAVRANAARLRLDAHIEEVGTVAIDPDRVSQIAGNLIDNAVRYTPEHGVVTVRLAAVGGVPELSVTDTGPGIDAQDLPHVFERLYVAQRYRPVRPEGSGLGLSIVKALADAMGAEVEVESSPGAGTTVRVRLVPSGVAAGATLSVGGGVLSGAS